MRPSLRCLVLDTDAVSHSVGLDLLPALEGVMVRLHGQTLIERSVYTEMSKQGLQRRVEEWQGRHLVQAQVDYRRLDKGDDLFRKLGGTRAYRLLSRQDRASLTLAVLNMPAGLLTCERLLAKAAADHGVLPIDLFDLVRFGRKFGQLSEEHARRLCQPWEDKFRAGRPNDYAGTYEAELARREGAKPLPGLE